MCVRAYVLSCVFVNLHNYNVIQVISDHIPSQSNSATDTSVSVAKTTLTVTITEKPDVKFTTGQNEGSSPEKGEFQLYHRNRNKSCT